MWNVQHLPQHAATLAIAPGPDRLKSVGRQLKSLITSSNTAPNAFSSTLSPPQSSHNCRNDKQQEDPSAGFINGLPHVSRYFGRLFLDIQYHIFLTHCADRLLAPIERQLIMNLLWLESAIPVSTMAAWVIREGRK